MRKSYMAFTRRQPSSAQVKVTIERNAFKPLHNGIGCSVFKKRGEYTVTMLLLPFASVKRKVLTVEHLGAEIKQSATSLILSAAASRFHAPGPPARTGKYSLITMRAVGLFVMTEIGDAIGSARE